MKIFVKVKPQSRENRLERHDDLDYTAYIKAPAREGKANEAVRDLLADYFNISRTHVRLILGKTSREKLFEIIKSPQKPRA